jgi:hypothetical protein
LANEAASLIACITRKQWCAPAWSPDQDARCTELTTGEVASRDIDAVFPDAPARDHAHWLRQVVYMLGNDLGFVASTLGASSLLARKLEMDGLQGTLPDNQ